MSAKPGVVDWLRCRVLPALHFAVSWGLFVIALLTLTPRWRAAGLPLLLLISLCFVVGQVVGLLCSTVVARLFPDLRFSTPNKVVGLGYVWTVADLVMPSVSMMVLFIVVAIVLHFVRHH